MIFNRTQADISAAHNLINTKVKTFQELTHEEVAILEKGTMTINTLNRIEQKQEELKGLFNSMGYWNTPVVIKTWDYKDIFNVSEFQRIIYNLDILRNAFFTYSTTPNTPPVSYRFEDINSLEKILNDLDVMINDVKSNYQECGDIECGEE